LPSGATFVEIMTGFHVCLHSRISTMNYVRFCTCCIGDVQCLLWRDRFASWWYIFMLSLSVKYSVTKCSPTSS